MLRIHDDPLEPDGSDLLSVVADRLAQDGPVQCRLAGGGLLNIDRLLPFLCVYHQPEGDADSGTDQLVTGQAAYLLIHRHDRAQDPTARLLQLIIEKALDQFGAFLVVVIAADPSFEANRPALTSGERLPPCPEFRITVSPTDTPWRTVDALRRTLSELKLLKQQAEVEVVTDKRPLPLEVRKIMPFALDKHPTLFELRLDVRPIYRDENTGEIFPEVLRKLRRRLGRALGQALFTFTHTHTSVQPVHYHTLGRRALVKSVWSIDRRLATVSRSFDLLLQATPVNVEAAWRQFVRGRFQKPPVFHYRPATVEPALLKRRLFQIPLERVEDPTMFFLFREQQDAIDRRITMLTDIGTSRFLAGSTQVFGTVSDELLSKAQELLAKVPHTHNPRGAEIDAFQFAEHALERVNYYRSKNPEFRAEVVVRDDLFSGLLVSGETLLVGRNTRIDRQRMGALIAHEVSTHLLTYFNARRQPFRQLDHGLPRYDRLQEGLAVLSEYLVGGLTAARVRLLAARVVAVWQLAHGASFIDTFRTLSKEYEFARKTAYTIAMRVYRGGGLTKDAAYLRGLFQLLEYLRGGGEIEPLYIGKIAVEHLPIIEELRMRNILHPLPLLPDYLDEEEGRRRLEQTRSGISVSEMIEDVRQ